MIIRIRSEYLKPLDVSVNYLYLIGIFDII